MEEGGELKDISKKQLIKELEELHKQIAKLKKSEVMKLAMHLKENAINSTISAFAIADLEGNLTYVNQYFLELWGYNKAEEVLGKPLALFWENKDKIKKLNIVLQKKGSWCGEILARRKDGLTLFFAEVFANMVFDETGKHTKMVFSLIDITNRKRAENALKNSEESYRDLVEKAAIAVLIDDIDGNFKYFNERFTELFGYSTEEMEEQSIKTLAHSEGVEHVMEYHKKRLQGKKVPLRYGFKGIKEDGSTIYLEVDAAPIEIANRIIGTRSYIWDITKHKLIEEEFRYSEEKYRNIVELSPDGIMIFDLKGIVTSCNDAILRQSGYSKEEIVGKHFTKLPATRVSDLPKFIKINNLLKIGKTPRPFEFNWIHKNGAIHCGEVLFSFLKKGGKTTEVQAFIRDITERKRAEEALQESETSYKELANSISDVFFAMDKDLKYTYWNRASEKLTGIKSEEAIGKSIFEIFPDNEETKKAVSVYQEVLKTQQPQNFVTEYHLSGKNYFFEISVYPSKHGLSVFVKDIQERKKVEEELKKSEEKYKSLSDELELILDNIPAVVVYKDKDNKLIRVNKYVADAYNLSKEELEGKSLFEFHPEEQAQAYWDDDLEVIKSGKPKLHYEEPWETPEGVRCVSTSKIPYVDKNGETMGIVALSTDITERKKAEEELKRRLEMERGLSKISETLVKAKQIDIAVEETLAILGKMFDADRVSLFQAKENGKIWTNTHEWHRKGRKSLKKGLKKLSFDDFSWWIRKLEREKLIEVPDVEKLPSIAKKEMKKFKVQNIKSLLVTPLCFKDKLFGAIGLYRTKENKTWLKQDIEILNAAGEIIITSLVKDRFQKELGQALEEVKIGQQRLRELTKRTIETQEKERSYLASEIHDELLQNLVATLYFLQMLDISSLDKKINRKKEKLIELIGRSIDGGRTLISEIEPIRDPELGLTYAIKNSIKQILAGSEINVNFNYPEKLFEMDFATKTNVLRIIQESVMNVRKHAKASRLSIKLMVLKTIFKVEIKDNGVGFDLEAVSKTPFGHYGVLAMEERTRLAGGEIKIKSKVGKGTNIKCVFPLDKIKINEKDKNPRR